MKIQNDRIIFEPNDAAALSPGLAQEISASTNGKMPAEDVLTHAIDALISNVRKTSLSRLQRQIGTLSAEKRASVASLLTQVQDVINAPEVPKEGGVVVEEKQADSPGLVARIKNLFS